MPPFSSVLLRTWGGRLALARVAAETCPRDGLKGTVQCSGGPPNTSEAARLCVLSGEGSSFGKV